MVIRWDNLFFEPNSGVDPDDPRYEGGLGAGPFGGRRQGGDTRLRRFPNPQGLSSESN